MRTAKSVSAIFKKVEVQLSAVISKVANSESLVRVPRTSDTDMHDTRTILRPILRYTYDSDSFIRVTRTSLSYVHHHLKTVESFVVLCLLSIFQPVPGVTTGVDAPTRVRIPRQVS